MKLLKWLVIIAGILFILTAASFVTMLNAPNATMYNVTYWGARIGGFLLIADFGTIVVLNIMGFFKRK